MPNSSRLALAAPLAIALMAAAPAALAQPVAAAGASATTQMTRQWDFTSTVNGRSYRVKVAMPVGPAPANGYPALYVTDSGGFFGAFTDTVRVRGAGGEVAPTVIIGIGYPEEDFGVQFSRRTLDLTPTPADPVTAARSKAQSTSGKAPEYGGADDFVKIIETEIKPRVAALAKVDPARTVLYGHSLGGLFATHVLLTRPDAFQTYLISSPSLWWNNKAVLQHEAGFAARLKTAQVAPRVFILVGGEEQTPPPPPYPLGMTASELAKATLDSAMIDNARSLGVRLAALRGPAGYTVQTRVFENESHMSVPFASLNALTSFALPAPGR